MPGGVRASLPPRPQLPAMRIPSPGAIGNMPPQQRLPFQSNIVGPPGPSPNQVCALIRFALIFAHLSNIEIINMRFILVFLYCVFNFYCFFFFYVRRATVLKRTRGCADIADAKRLGRRGLSGSAGHVSVWTAHDVACSQLPRDAQQWTRTCFTITFGKGL